MLITYGGDREAREAFRASVLNHPSPRGERGECLERYLERRVSTKSKPRQMLRCSHSKDLLVGPVADGVSSRRKLREENRLVDFAHTTTRRD